MFGCHAVYVKEKIVLILRRKETTRKTMESGLQQRGNITIVSKKIFPACEPFASLEEPKVAGKIYRQTVMHFEEEVMKACNLF